MTLYCDRCLNKIERFKGDKGEYLNYAYKIEITLFEQMKNKEIETLSTMFLCEFCFTCFQTEYSNMQKEARFKYLIDLIAKL